MWYANGIPEMIAFAKKASTALENAKNVAASDVSSDGVTEKAADKTIAKPVIDSDELGVSIKEVESEPPVVDVKDTLIAGIDVSAWMAWEMVMASLKRWINEPVGENMQSPMMILAKRYNRKA